MADQLHGLGSATVEWISKCAENEPTRLASGLLSAGSKEAGFSSRRRDQKKEARRMDGWLWKKEEEEEEKLTRVTHSASSEAQTRPITSAAESALPGPNSQRLCPRDPPAEPAGGRYLVLETAAGSSRHDDPA